jgi:O-antigen/teichoic acid export membrane protein
MPNVTATIIGQACTAAAVVILVPHFGVTGYGAATACSLVSLLYIQRVVRREIVRFSYKRLWPFVIALGPIILMPLAPMPWALIMLAPLIATFSLPGPRDSLRHAYDLMKLALLREPTALGSSST